MSTTSNVAIAAVVLALAGALSVRAQPATPDVPPRAESTEERIGIHELELRAHRDDSTSAHVGAMSAPLARAEAAVSLRRRVVGWLPYWTDTSLVSTIDFGTLETVAWFSAEVDPETGGLRTTRGWPVGWLRDLTRARGVRLVLTVTNFGAGANAAVLGDTARRRALVAATVDAVRAGQGDGVNIDFESVPGDQRANLVTFMRELATDLRAAIPGADVSMAIPAVDWSGAFDARALSEICDALIVMGYDYHWSSAPTAGPVAPLEGETYNVTRSVATWLGAGVPAARLLLGVPWYGYDWPVVDSTRGAAALGRGFAVLYASAVGNAEARGRMWDAATSTPWYRYRVDTLWRQAWYDDSTSLGLKYALVERQDLGGVGIWALGYQGVRTELWAGLRQAFGPVGHSDVESGGDLTVSFDGTSLTVGGASGGATITLVDVLGRRVAEIDASGVGPRRIDRGELRLPPGRYLARVRARNGSTVTRLIMWR